MNELLARVLDDPDSDEARAVYADSLLAEGDPRGELIQIQLQLAKMLPTHPAFGSLVAAQDKLIAAHGELWLPPDGARLRRGFIDTVYWKKGTLHAATQPWLDENPVTRLDLKRWGGTAPALPRLREIVATYAPDIHRFRATLAVARDVRRFEVPARPEFMSLVPDDAEITAHIGLGCDPSLLAGRKLVGLHVDAVIGGSDLGGTWPALDWLTLQGFRSMPELPRVRRLCFQTHIGDRAFQRLAEDPILASVEELELGDGQLGAPGLQALARSPHLHRLTRLSVRTSTLDAWVIDALAQFARRVRVLDLRSMFARIQGDLRRLFEAPVAVLGLPQLDREQSRRLVKLAPPTMVRVMLDMENPIIDARWRRAWTLFDE